LGKGALDEAFGDSSGQLVYATNENQNAPYALNGGGSDLGIVGGGYNPSKSPPHGALCQAAMPTYFIRNADEIVSASQIRHFLLATRQMASTDGWLPEKHPLDVALTCGASCPDAIVDGVLFRILSFFEPTRPLEEVLQPYPLEV